MATRKLVLAGSAKSPWVSTRFMPDPHLEVQMGEGTVLDVLCGDEGVRLVTAGKHRIPQAPWTRVFVVEGDPTSVLVTVVSRGS